MKKIIIIIGLLLFVGCVNEDRREETEKFRQSSVVILTDTSDNKKYVVKHWRGNRYTIDPVKEE
jgi:hypothetical protein